MVLMNSGSERSGIIAPDDSPENFGVLSHSLFFLSFLAACLAVHYFVKTKNILP